MNTAWNKVTKLSQGIAIVLGLAIFVTGFYLGTLYQQIEHKKLQMRYLQHGVDNR